MTKIKAIYKDKSELAIKQDAVLANDINSDHNKIVD